MGRLTRISSGDGGRRVCGTRIGLSLIRGQRRSPPKTVPKSVESRVLDAERRQCIDHGVVDRKDRIDGRYPSARASYSHVGVSAWETSTSPRTATTEASAVTARWAVIRSDIEEPTVRFDDTYLIAEVELALAGGMFCDVGRPQLVRGGGGELATHPPAVK